MFLGGFSFAAENTSNAPFMKSSNVFLFMFCSWRDCCANSLFELMVIMLKAMTSASGPMKAL